MSDDIIVMSKIGIISYCFKMQIICSHTMCIDNGPIQPIPTKIISKCEVSEHFWRKWPSVRRGEEAVAAFTSSPSIDGGSLSTEDGGGGSLSAEDSGAAASTLALAGIVSTARHDSSLLLSARRAVSNFKP